ncbi:MAG: hypothetical protein MZV70_35095 [Desulfobacterales bacterium]|nr:hypothetical protein [Desulfobacterales bacterium]
MGCVVQNVGTLVAVADAFNKGQAPDRAGLHDHRRGLRRPRRTWWSPSGPWSRTWSRTRSRWTTRTWPGWWPAVPMMGPAVPSYAFPIQKNTSGVLLMDKEEARYFQEEPCIRCGRCMRACSCRLSPALLNEALNAGDLDAGGGHRGPGLHRVRDLQLRLPLPDPAGPALPRSASSSSAPRSRRRPNVPANSLLLSSSPHVYSGVTHPPADARR